MRLIRSATVIGSPVTLLVAVVSEVMNGSMCWRRSSWFRRSSWGRRRRGTGRNGPIGWPGADRFGDAGGVFAVQVGHERRSQRCGNVDHPLLEGQRGDRRSCLCIKNAEVEQNLAGAVGGAAIVLGAASGTFLANMAGVQ